MNFLPVSRYRIRSYTGICRPAAAFGRLSPAVARPPRPAPPPGARVDRVRVQVCTRSSSMPGSSSTSSYVHLKCGLTLCDCPYVYERSDEDAGHLEAKWAERVQTLLIDRAARRRERDYARADAILEELQGMGVAVDDKQRLWSVTAAAAPTTQEAAQSSQPRTQQKRPRCDPPEATSDGSGVECKMCGQLFSSRNLVFKHLRDPQSGCGESVAQQGGLEPSPGEEAKAARPARRAARQRPGQTARHASAESCLWFGDLPLPWTRAAGKHRRLTALLYHHMPRGVPQPWLKKVVRKGYRDKSTGAYLGYAIVAFRDKDEAQSVLPAMHSLQVSPEVSGATVFCAIALLWKRTIDQMWLGWLARFSGGIQSHTQARRLGFCSLLTRQRLCCGDRLYWALRTAAAAAAAGRASTEWTTELYPQSAPV
jgi:hypothetical protein